MNVRDGNPPALASTGPDRASFHATSCALWLAGAIPMSLAIAWLTVWIEPHFAPVVVFPLLVGLTLGVALAVWMRLCRMGHRNSVLLGLLVAAVTLVFGQHYFAYRKTLDQVDDRLAVVLQAQLEQGKLNNLDLPLPPQSLPDFLRQTADRGRPLAGYMLHGAGVWAWWGLDAALTLAGAAIPVWIALKRPYCPRCRTWFHLIRGGPVDRATACKIAGRLGLPTASAGAATYRLLSCRAGCAKCAFELSWDEPPGGDACVFLDAALREQITTILDSAISRPSTAPSQDT